MSRANRTYVAGHYWHITHRCHQKEFLLRFSEERRRWLYWLYQARRRYGFCVLNYIVTRNHIHLLIRDVGTDEIAKSMQLIAGRLAQEFNNRKSRRGAFWQDRYHATAVESGSHLLRCMLYIDLNMVRAGEVSHPADWPHSGYNEIMNPKTRGRRINYGCLLDSLGFKTMPELQTSYRRWVDSRLDSGIQAREPVWTESIAVGGFEFTGTMQKELGFGAKGRKRTPEAVGFSLK